MKARAVVLYAAGESDANLYYATRFLTPDPYVFVQVGRRKIIAMSDLEIGRAREEATVGEVKSLSEAERALKASGIRVSGPADVIAWILRGRARRVEVPANFPVQVADGLRKRKIAVDVRPGVFWKQRQAKRPDEVRAIEETQRAVEEAVAKAIGVLRRAKVRGNRIVSDGEALTSESLRRVINLALMERECVGRGTIVACGDQSCDPHMHGTGLLRPDQTIILDVYPRSGRTQYFADMSRTVVKGRASPAVRRQYAAVLEAQEQAISRIRAGVRGRAVHREVQEHFRKLGYVTEPRGGKMAGFFHGTGHGVGLDIHEAPWLNPRGGPLPAGAVVTVEPGLYYPGVGGVRLEDMVLVREGGCRNLTRFPKFLEV